MDTCHQTINPASRIDQVFEEHHYEVSGDNWRPGSKRLHMPKWRSIQRHIKDARTLT